MKIPGIRKSNPSSKFWWTLISPWGFIGAAAILFPILAYLTLTDIQRQNLQSVNLMLEKGGALIRFIEAGTRTGMMWHEWSRRQLEELLQETARQSDIVRIRIVDTRGDVLADSQPGETGDRYATNLDLPAIAASGELMYRRLSDRPKPVFEVYRRFLPAMGMGMGYGGMGMMHRFYQNSGQGNDRLTGDPGPQIIFVSLDMSDVDAARVADVRHSIVMGVILLLVGLAGIALLFLAQGYRATQASLSRLTSFSESLLAEMPMGLIALDADQRLTALNPAAHRILRLPEDAAAGAPAAAVFPPEIASLLGRLASAPDGIEEELDCCIREAHPVPLAISASAWYGSAGERQGHILLVKDLTEIRSLRDEIEQNRRMAAIGNLAAGVAHEIRNPLSSIKGFATYFKQRYRGVETDVQTASIMIEEVDRLNRVVSQLLELARPVNLSAKAQPLAPLVEAAATMVRQQAEGARVRVETRLPADLPDVPLDPDRMRQVFLNLMLNAIDAMPDGGRLSVSAAALGSNGGIAIQVADTGGGIPADRQNQIFDPYYTTKSTGTGLGLAIVHNIMKAHGGTDAVESTQGIGTAFTLTLNAAPPGETSNP